MSGKDQPTCREMPWSRKERGPEKGKPQSATMQVRSYSCESCLVLGRMAEQVQITGKPGADVVSLQGTQMTAESPWIHNT